MVDSFWGVTFSIYSEGLYGGVFVSTFGVLELYTSLEVLVYPLFFSVKALINETYLTPSVVLMLEVNCIIIFLKLIKFTWQLNNGR